MRTIPFFYGDRLHLQNGRGAFETSSDYLTSLLHLHISSTTNRKNAVSTDDECDEDDISEFEDTIAAYESLLSVLPVCFPPEARDAETFFLFHHDLSPDKILVDPTTQRITGITDWECVSLQPSWEAAARVPQLLEGPEVEDGSPIPDAAPARTSCTRSCGSGTSRCFCDAFIAMRWAAVTHMPAGRASVCSRVNCSRWMSGRRPS
jgi:hypothetical protein